MENASAFGKSGAFPCDVHLNGGINCLFLNSVGAVALGKLMSVMMDVKFNAAELLEFNAKLNKIKAPIKKPLSTKDPSDRRGIFDFSIIAHQGS